MQKSSEVSTRRPFSPIRMKAFTLLEILLVVALIGVLSGILLPTLGNVRFAANKAKTRVQFGQWAAGLEQFKSEYGYYPRLHTAGVLDPAKLLAALTARHASGTPFSAAALNGNTRRFIFCGFAPDEIVTAPDGTLLDEVVDAFGNSRIGVAIDADEDGIIRGGELIPAGLEPGNSVDGFGPLIAAADPDLLRAEGIRARIIFYSAGRGRSAGDFVFSWK